MSDSIPFPTKPQDGGIMSGPCQVTLADGICGRPFRDHEMHQLRHSFHSKAPNRVTARAGFYEAEKNPQMAPNLAVAEVSLAVDLANAQAHEAEEIEYFTNRAMELAHTATPERTAELEQFVREANEPRPVVQRISGVLPQRKPRGSLLFRLWKRIVRLGES